MRLPVMPPVLPMLAKAVDGLPPGDVSFEPKWDGFRCIVFRDGDEVELGSRNERPLTRYFPEILEPLRRSLPARCVLDGELVVARHGRLDFDALQQRIHPAASRVNRLAAETPASFVAFDVLALDDVDCMPLPFRERRRALEQLAVGFTAPVHCTPATTDRAVAAEWFERFEGAGLDGVMAKPLDQPYVPDKRTQFKVKHQRTADCVVAGFRMHKDGEGIGSLLLGIFDERGHLNHVGVATSFTAARRRQLVGEIAPIRMEGIAGHPWAAWASQGLEPAPGDLAPGGAMPGAPSRWNAKKDLSWTPLRTEWVAEVAYEGLIGHRFRHSARLVRWRPDRTPASCTYDQLDTPAPYELSQIFGA
jgi:ATP-dependent DNA ligase